MRVIEWRWNLRRLTRRDHEWQRQHWFSSGFDERSAERERQRVCDANDEPSAESLSWLRRSLEKGLRVAGILTGV